MQTLRNTTLREKEEINCELIVNVVVNLHALGHTIPPQPYGGSIQEKGRRHPRHPGMSWVRALTWVVRPMFCMVLNILT